MKFNRFIVRLRSKFNDLFFDLLKKQLILKGIIAPEDWGTIEQTLIFDFTQDSYYAEIKNTEMISFRVDLLSNMTDYIGKYYSSKWIMTNLLKFTEDEMKQMKKEMSDVSLFSFWAQAGLGPGTSAQDFGSLGKGDLGNSL